MQFIFQIHCSVSPLLNLIRCHVQILCIHQGQVPIPFLPWFIPETSPSHLWAFYLLCLFPATVYTNPLLQPQWNSLFPKHNRLFSTSLLLLTLFLSPEMLIPNLPLLKFSLSCKSQFKCPLPWSLTSFLPTYPASSPLCLLTALLFSFWVTCPPHFQSMRFSWSQPGMAMWCGSANHNTTCP